MKTLSIRQPWAWLLSHGLKEVENRPWRTHCRGWVLLHAAKAMEAEFVRRFARELAELDLPQTFDRGGIVGVARLVECVTEHDSRWFAGPYGFVLNDARPLVFTPCRGMLGLFDLPGRLERDRFVLGGDP